MPICYCIALCKKVWNHLSLSSPDYVSLLWQSHFFFIGVSEVLWRIQKGPSLGLCFPSSPLLEIPELLPLGCFSWSLNQKLSRLLCLSQDLWQYPFYIHLLSTLHCTCSCTSLPFFMRFQATLCLTHLPVPHCICVTQGTLGVTTRWWELQDCNIEKVWVQQNQWLWHGWHLFPQIGVLRQTANFLGKFNSFLEICFCPCRSDRRTCPSAA